MSRNTKIVLGIIGGLFILCICAGVVAFLALRSAGPLVERAMTVTEKPEEVTDIAQGIVDYTLPAGYSEQFGMSFFGFDVAAFGSAGPAKQMIMLMQFPESAGLSQAEMEQQMQQATERQMGRRNYQLPVVGETTTTIRDQRITLTIREGTDSDGTAIRQVSGVFQGKSGIVMLMIMGNRQNWDQEAVDAFIASLR